MSTAWVFPGQDAFEPTTGLAWSEASEVVARNLDVASGIVGLDLRERRLRRRVDVFDTAVVQPLLTALCLGIAAEIGTRPDVVAGASLGELSAWAVSTQLPVEQAIGVAAARGRAMANAGVSGAMAAVRGTAQVIEVLCIEGVTVGARNGVDDWVLTGPEVAIARLGGRRVPVCGPWHSPAMAPAVPGFARALVHGGRPVLPWVLNDSGRLVLDADDARGHLLAQLTAPADWYATVRGLVRLGVTDVLTVGPGRVLRTQLRRIAPELRVRGTDRPEDLAR